MAPHSSDSDAFWNELRVTGDEAEFYPDYSSMAMGSDLVILGTFGEFQAGRSQEISDEDVVSYAVTTVDVAQVTAGSSLPPDELVLEFLLPVPPSSVNDVLEVANDHAPREQMMLFLRQKAGMGANGPYRLVNSKGLVIEGSEHVRAPLAEEPGLVADPGLVDATSLAEFARAIEP